MEYFFIISLLFCVQFNVIDISKISLTLRGLVTGGVKKCIKSGNISSPFKLWTGRWLICLVPKSITISLHI